MPSKGDEMSRKSRNSAHLVLEEWSAHTVRALTIIDNGLTVPFPFISL
jgi:hypothetical protein